MNHLVDIRSREERALLALVTVRWHAPYIVMRYKP